MWLSFWLTDPQFMSLKMESRNKKRKNIAINVSILFYLKIVKVEFSIKTHPGPSSLAVNTPIKLFLTLTVALTAIINGYLT